MASLLHCPSASEHCCSRVMNIAGACPQPHPFLCRRTPLSYRFLSTFMWCRIPLINVFRFSHVKTHYSFARPPHLSMMKGKSTDSLKGSCEVVWTVEADLAEGQTLYVTGDPAVLGCWEPEVAILMSPTEHKNLWKAKVKIASGVNFKYNYFVKEETLTTCDIIWRPGPEFSLLVPLVVEQNKSIVVKDMWIRSDSRKVLTQVWGSLIEETYLPIGSMLSPLVTDGYEIIKSSQKSSSELKPLLTYLGDEDIATETCSRSNFSRTFSERDQPVEEPWLPSSHLFSHLSNDVIGPDALESKETVQDETVTDFNESLLPRNEGDLGSIKESVPIIILINSSICTMQRIAVLEDGKLVELLLEPVKSNVQCDSVYLGLISKLVPHMGGAFVNIGNSRHSLMDIKQNREPFIFPPFHSTSKKKDNNNIVMGALRDRSDVHECEHMTKDNIEAVDNHLEVDSYNNSIQSMHDDDEEPDIEDDFEVPELLKENSNGSIVDYVEDEAEFEDSLDPDDADKSYLKDKGDYSDNCLQESSWSLVRKGTKIIVQIVKEGLGTKGPTLTAYPKLRSRFWILITRCDRVGVSKKISGIERTRLKVIAKTLQPPGFGLTVRTVAAGRSLEELQKDLEGLLSTWKNIIEHAKSAALAADEGVEGAAPVILHRAMGQTLSVVQDYFNDKVEKMVVDSPRTYHEVTNYLQDIAPDLCDRIELHDKRIPLFDEYNIEEEINGILSKRVPLPNGGSLVIEQTEALVSIDVNGGHGMFGHGNTQEKAILDVNLAAAKQIARELRLRDIGGIIVVDFIDMTDESNKRLVYEEVKKAVERDRSMVKVSELSRHGLMEITRKRVRPSVTFMISEPCTCCNATGRVEALETSFSKIEQEICRLLAAISQKADPENPKSWPRFVLRVDNHMCNYLTSGKRTRLAVLSSSLKVWILLKVARGLSRGEFEVKPFTDDKATKNQHHATISVLRQTDSKTKNSSKKVTVFPVKKLKASRK